MRKDEQLTPTQINKTLELSDRDSKAVISKMLKAITSSLTTNEKVQSLRKVKPENPVEII